MPVWFCGWVAGHDCKLEKRRCRCRTQRNRSSHSFEDLLPQHVSDHISSILTNIHLIKNSSGLAGRWHVDAATHGQQSLCLAVGGDHVSGERPGCKLRSAPVATKPAYHGPGEIDLEQRQHWTEAWLRSFDAQNLDGLKQQFGNTSKISKDDDPKELAGRCFNADFWRSGVLVEPCGMGWERLLQHVLTRCLAVAPTQLLIALAHILGEKKPQIVAECYRWLWHTLTLKSCIAAGFTRMFRIISNINLSQKLKNRHHQKHALQFDFSYFISTDLSNSPRASNQIFRNSSRHGPAVS